MYPPFRQRLEAAFVRPKAVEKLKAVINKKPKVRAFIRLGSLAKMATVPDDVVLEVRYLSFAGIE